MTSQLQPLLFKVYRNAVKIKSIYLPPNKGPLTHQDICVEIRKNADHDVIFFDSKTNLIETEERLMGVLHSIEKCTDVKLLTRVIKNGGFVEYIKQLEGDL